MSTLSEIINIFGEEHIVIIARELTKIFESIKKASAKELVDFYKENKIQTKGEFVLIITQSNSYIDMDEEIILRALKFTLKDLSLSQSVKLVSSIYNINKKEVYNLALRLKNE